MKEMTLILAVSFLIFSCNTEKKKVVKENPIKLHVLSGGKIIVNKLDLFAQDGSYKDQSKTFADAFYVIEHPKGNLMWDAGLPESLVGKEPYNSGAFTVSRKDSLKNQLKDLGLKVADFKYFALSHNHFDHIGHANTMKDATWLVQENEYNFFRSDAVKKAEPDLFEGIKELTKPKKLNGDYDVYGDGTVIIKYAPGHTIGHQTLFLNIGLEKPVILIGDLYHFEENRINKRVPIFNHNKEHTLKSMELIEKFAKEKGAEVIIQHSQNDFDRLKKMIVNN